MGNAYYFLKDFRKAVDAFKHALQVNGMNKDYHFNMANTSLQIDEF